MAFILPVNNIEPSFGKNCFIAPNATIVGDVVCGDDCSFWFNAVIRGDVNSIRLGNKVNIQDGAVIHCTYKKDEGTIRISGTQIGGKLDNYTWYYNQPSDFCEMFVPAQKEEEIVSAILQLFNTF